MGLRHRIDAEQIRCLNAKTCDPVIYLPFTSPTWRSMGSFRQGCKWGNNYILITHIRGLITPLMTTRTGLLQHPARCRGCLRCRPYSFHDRPSTPARRASPTSGRCPGIGTPPCSFPAAEMTIPGCFSWRTHQSLSSTSCRPHKCMCVLENTDAGRHAWFVRGSRGTGS